MDEPCKITVSGHGFNEGDELTIAAIDYRWWMRFWCFLRRKPAPMIYKNAIVSNVTESTFDTHGDSFDA